MVMGKQLNLCLKKKVMSYFIISLCDSFGIVSKHDIDVEDTADGSVREARQRIQLVL
jgi:hypothetical protein